MRYGKRNHSINQKNCARNSQALKNHITHAKLNQSDAAKLFGVTQPRISDLMRGKIHLFAIDALVNMAAVAGMHVEIRVLEVA